MNEFISPSKSAITFGVLFGGFHLAWSILVALGWAQACMDFIFWAHMFSLSFVVKAFDPVAAVTLVGITTVLGSLFGYFMAIVWNRLHRAV
ncbi:MAG: hypothetical protein NTV60_01090 [Candidatus Kaiserbacteria bacterium]|nr:hypothetical protein [Candidatus Kaiserbacteria bacterium]